MSVIKCLTAAAIMAAAAAPALAQDTPRTTADLNFCNAVEARTTASGTALTAEEQRRCSGLNSAGGTNAGSTATTNSQPSVAGSTIDTDLPATGRAATGVTAETDGATEPAPGTPSSHVTTTPAEAATDATIPQ